MNALVDLMGIEYNTKADAQGTLHGHHTHISSNITRCFAWPLLSGSVITGRFACNCSKEHEDIRTRAAPAAKALQGGKLLWCVPRGVIEEVMDVLLSCRNVEITHDDDLRFPSVPLVCARTYTCVWCVCAVCMR